MRKILNYILKTFIWENGYLGKEYELECILTYAEKDQEFHSSKIYETHLHDDYHTYIKNLLYNEIKEDGLIKVSTCLYGMNEQEYQKQMDKKFVKGLDKENGKLWFNDHLNKYA